MQLDLSADEVSVLSDVLDGALGEVREAIYKAEVTDYKEALRKRESILTRLLTELRANSSS
jgi:hypothetical protein